jgi:hypothetical protein
MYRKFVRQRVLALDGTTGVTITVVGGVQFSGTLARTTEGEVTITDTGAVATTIEIDDIVAVGAA